MPEIFIASPMYSPNLGDGVIAECLSYQMSQLNPEIAPTWLDLSARTSFSTATSSVYRAALLDAAYKLPSSIRNKILSLYVERQISRRLSPLLNERVNGSGPIVIGGGQLLSDENLNFPLKLRRVVKVAEDRNVDFAIHSVGVSQNWSHQGRKYFEEILDSRKLQFLSVRDAQSRDNLVAHMSRMSLTRSVDVEVFADPGIISSRVVKRDFSGHRSPPHVGLCVMDPIAIKIHGAGVIGESRKKYINRYEEICRKLVSLGFVVNLYTNGAPEDELFLRNIRDSEMNIFSSSSIFFLNRPDSPIDLIKMISSFDIVIAHRLHSNIIACSYGIPFVGLGWDKKMDAFFRASERIEFLLDGGMEDTSGIVDAAQNALDYPPNSDVVQRLIRNAELGVEQLLSSLLGKRNSEQ